jgi:hypothetical protein
LSASPGSSSSLLIGRVIAAMVSVVCRLISQIFET